MNKLFWIAFIVFSGLQLKAQLPSVKHSNRSTTDAAQFYQKMTPKLTGKWTSPPKDVVTKRLTRGAILGNGDVGATVGGDLSTLVFYIAKSDFWSSEIKLFEDSKKDPAPLPIGGISIIIKHQPHDANYLLEQVAVNAEVRSTFGTDAITITRSWIDANDNYLVTEIWTESALPVTVSVETWAKADHASYPSQAVVNGGIAVATRSTNSPDFIGAWTSKAAISTRIIGTAAKLSTDNKSISTSDFSISKGKPVKIISYISGGGKENNAYTKQSAEKLKALSGSSLNKKELLSRQWWKQYWNRSYIQLHDDTFEKYYYGALYEIAASTKNSKVCPGLYGIWITTDSASWHSDIHLNYNGEGPFYGLFSSNRSELTHSYYDIFLDFIPEGERRAKNDAYKLNKDLKGKSLKGVLFPVGLGPWGSVTDDVYLNQTINASFSSVIFIWNYEYMQDKLFLKTKSYPFIRKIGDFFEDYLKVDTVGGERKYVLWTGAHEESWNKNASLDLGFVRMVYKFLLKASGDLNIDQDQKEKWAAILNKLSDFPTATIEGKKMFTLDDAGWLFPKNNLSVLEFIYPAGALGFSSNPDSLQLAHNTIDYYTRPGYPGYFNINNFIKIFPIAIQSNYNPDVLLPNFKKVIKAQLQNNMTINDGVHGIEKAGAIDAINMMLLQSYDDVMILFPYWKKAASFKKLRAKGAFLVSAEQNEDIKNISIFSEKGNTCKMVNPWPESSPTIYTTFRGTKKQVDYVKQGNILSFRTSPGEEYILHQ